MPKIIRFYTWSPQWRNRPQTHEVLVEVDNGGGGTIATPIATCSSKAWADKVEQALTALLNLENR